MSQPIDPSVQVILIDDDPHLRQALYQTLDLAGLNVLPLAEANGLAERIGHRIRRGLHQIAVERGGYGQQHAALDPVVLDHRHHPLDRLAVA